MTVRATPVRGLSPPTRGNRLKPRAVGARLGSIPAHAGEPLRLPNNQRGRGVYPRPRGGTTTMIEG